ncbi:MAG: S8 family serine peptidase, partial [Thermoplasmata archaeon]
RDSSGRPIYMDADGMSLGITGMYFFINLTSGYPTNWSSNIPLPYMGNFTRGAYYYGAAIVNNSNIYLPTRGLSAYIYDINLILKGATEPFILYAIPENVTLGNISNYIKPAAFTYKYGNYTMKVGIYAFGFLSMPIITDGYYDPLGLSNLWKYNITVVPTLVIPSTNFWNFDTVYITGWNTYLNDLGYSTDPFSFVQYSLNTLEPPHHINDNTIFLSYYYPQYGIYVDFGTIGGNTLLPNFALASPMFNFMYGAYGGNIISGLSKDGFVYSNLISFDYGEYHGTFTASVVASHGNIGYNLYRNGTYYKLPGIAPGAKIISVPALYIGDVFFGWMWAAGFDFNSTTLTWTYTGQHRAQIESNSWGISEWPILFTGIGYDAMSALEDTLMLPGVMAPDYPGTLFVHAMGNGGPGYGTDTSSGGALLPLTVGASTESNWLRAYGWGLSNKSGQVIAWSDRGPAYTGDIKPDVVAVGAFSWVPASIDYWEGLPWLPPGVGIFGGTSQATPMTAGVAALVIQAMNEKHMSFDPIYVKNVIMNTAIDLYNAPYTQGAGQVNTYYAVADVLGNSTVGAFYTTSNATYQNVMNQIYAMLSYWSSMFGTNITYPVSVPMANWFAGYLSPGQSTQNTFNVMNPTNSSLSIGISTQNLVVVDQK